MNKAQKALLGALIGLARALNDANSSYEAFEIIVKSLCMLQADEGALICLTEQVRNAKRYAAPDCAACQHPCGRTADYNAEDLALLSPEVRERKFELLAECEKYVRSLKVSADAYRPHLDRLSEALFAIGYDYFSAEEMEEEIHKIRR